MDDKTQKRKEESAHNFWQYVRPLLEKKLHIEILPLELLQDNKVTEAFDKAGVDAFYIEHGLLRGLGSRIRSSRFGGESFTFRYSPNKEYERRKEAISDSLQHVIFPHLHVESFLDKESGLITWSHAAKTYDIIKCIMAHEASLLKNAGNRDAIRIEKVRNPEREVIIVPISIFKKEYEVTKLGN